MGRSISAITIVGMKVKQSFIKDYKIDKIRFEGTCKEYIDKYILYYDYDNNFVYISIYLKEIDPYYADKKQNKCPFSLEKLLRMKKEMREYFFDIKNFADVFGIYSILYDEW